MTMQIVDPHDNEYVLHVGETEDAGVLELRATNGLKSLTIDVKMTDLLEAIDAARAAGPLVPA